MRDGGRGLPPRRRVEGPTGSLATADTVPPPHAVGAGHTRVLVVEGSDGIEALVERAVVEAVGDVVEVVHTVADATEGPAVLVNRLSDEDVRLWHLVACGCYDTEIANRLFVSERTVKRRVASLLQRLGVERRIEAATLAGRVGLGGVA